jgi:hypothetical protein
MFAKRAMKRRTTALINVDRLRFVEGRSECLVPLV